jgi:uncharacterized protein (DUF305 family)
MRRASIVIVGVLLLAAGCGVAEPGAAPAAATSVHTAHGAGDLAFVRAMIPHHRQGIALAGAAAQRPRARTLAEAIIVTQQDEIVRMTGWLQAWGETAPPSAAPTTPAGDPIRQLIAHQEEAVRLAQQEQGQGSNPDALAFAKQVIESRTEEVDQLRTYLG